VISFLSEALINNKDRFKAVGAVIFDLDGLMVYSEELSLKSWRQFLAGYGFWMEEEEYRPLIGIDSRLSTDYVVKKTGLQIAPEEILKRRREMMLALVDEQLPVADGLFSLINRLSDFHYPMAVASNNFREYVERILQVIDLRQFFKCVITIDDVINSKPSPDVYMEASKCLGIPMSQCLALEDSPVGMEAALRAGMTCVVITNRNLHGVDFPEAHACFDSLTDFITFFYPYMSSQDKLHFAEG
jgi:beta-phosphoglucomutase